MARWLGKGEPANGKGVHCSVEVLSSCPLRIGAEGWTECRSLCGLNWKSLVLYRSVASSRSSMFGSIIERLAVD